MWWNAQRIYLLSDQMNGMEIPKSGLRTNKKPILYTNEGNYK